MKIATKIILVVLCAALVIGASIMGTIAYLQSQSDVGSIVMTVGNVSVTLTGTDAGATNMLTPGTTIALAPQVTVSADSQDCWLFVRIDEKGSATIGDQTYGFTDFLSYALAEGWEKLDVADANIYFRHVPASQAENGMEAADQKFDILGADPANPSNWSANQIYVNATVTEKMLAALDAADAVKPELVFTAYAIQSSGFATGADAWNAIEEQMTPAVSVPETSSADATDATTEPTA